MVFVAIWGMFGVVTALAADARGRNPVAWFFTGCVGGVFALIAVLVMENMKGKEGNAGPRPLSYRKEDDGNY